MSDFTCAVEHCPFHGIEEYDELCLGHHGIDKMPIYHVGAGVKEQRLVGAPIKFLGFYNGNMNDLIFHLDEDYGDSKKGAILNLGTFEVYEYAEGRGR